MSDFSVNNENEYPVCRAPVYQRPDGSGDPPAVDSPHGLGEALGMSLDVFTQVTTDPIQYIKKVGVLSQLFDRPGSLHEIQFQGPLLEGIFLSDLKVNPDTWMTGRLSVMDGYPEGEFNFFPPVIQLGFNPEKDLPSNNEFALLHAPLLDDITLDIDVHQIRIVTETDPNDPNKKMTRFKAKISFMTLPKIPGISKLADIPIIGEPLLGATRGYTYRDIDVTELFTRRYLGDEHQMSEVKFPFSQFAEMAVNHIQSGAFKNLNMFDPAGIRFNIKTSSDGTFLPYDGPHEICRDDLNLACSSLDYHWDYLSLGNGIELHNVDARMFVFPNPLTNGYLIEIPTANVGKLIQRLDSDTPLSHDPSSLPDPTRSITLSNAGIENLTLEVVPKDPTNLLAGVYIKEGKGKLLFDGGSILTDVVLGHMGSGIDFEVKGDENGNLSAHLALPGTVLEKADLFLLGGVSTQIRNNFLYDGSIDVSYTDDVWSYDADFQSDLMCMAAAGTNSFVDFSTNVEDFSCQEISLSSDNVFDSHDVSINSCDGSLQGNARLFGDVPLQVSFDTSFSDFDAQLAMSLPQTPGALPEIVLNSVDLPDFSFGLNAGLWGYTAGVNVMDGARTTLDGVDIPEGIHIKTVDGILKVEINIDQAIELEGPEGKVKIDGQVVGTVDLVLVKNPGGLPKLLPVVGSLNLEMTHGTAVFVSALGVSTRLKGRVRISDDASGKITLMDSTAVTKPIPLKVNTDAAITLTQSKKTQTVHGRAVTVYDLPDGADVTFTTKLTERHIGILRTTGSLSVAGLHNGNLQAKIEVKTPFGNRKVKIDGVTIEVKGGGVKVKGTEKKIGVDFTPPKTIDIRFSQTHDGVTYEFAGTLENNASFHTDIANPFSLGDQKIKFKQNSGKDPAFVGTLTVVARDAQNNKIGEGKLKISSDYHVDGTMSLDGGRFSLKVPSTGITGEVVEDFTIGGITAKKGSKLDIPIGTFDLTAELDPRDFSVKSEMTINGFGPATLTILDSPLENLPQVPMKGPVEIAFEGGLAGQKIVVKFDPKKGITFEAVPPMKPTTMKARIKVGDDVDIVLDSETRADSLGGSANADEIVFKMTKLSLQSEIDGKANVQGLAIDLNDLDTQALLDKIEIVYNRKTGEIQFRLDAPQPQGVTSPPTDFDSWMKWTKKQWSDYRKQMNGTDHMVVLSETAAKMPGSSNFIPLGRGKVFIDLAPKTYTVNLKDFNGNAPLALAGLLGQVFPDVIKGMRREYPNPPKQDSPKQAILYNEGQDALFIIDNKDTKLKEQIEKGLGISPEEAQALFDNERIDMDYLVGRPALNRYFSEDVLRGLMHAFFDDEDGDPSLFFYALEDLQANTSKMVNTEQAPWTKGDKKVRTVLFSDLRKDRKDNWVEAEGIAYLPYDAEAVYSIVGDPGHLDHWIPWLSDTESTGKGSFQGEIFDDYDFNGTVTRDSSGGVKKVAYRLGSGGGDLEKFEVDFIVVPAKKGGVFLFQRHLVDLKGDDAKIYKGRDRDTTSGGDPKRSPLKMDRLLSAFNRTVSPNQDPTEIFNFLQAVSVSHLSDTLFERKKRGDEDLWIDFRKYEITTDSLSYIPGGLRSTIPPEEFLVYDPATKMLALSVPKDPEKKKDLESLLKKAFGDQLAAKAIQDKRIELKDLKELDFIQEYVPDESLESLAQYILIDLNRFFREAGYDYDPFTSKSERFLYLMIDMRERLDDWTGENGSRKMDFRSFSSKRFHNWNSEHNRWKPGDGTDSVVYSVVRGDVDFEKLLEVISKPEDFSKYTKAIKGSKKVENAADSQRPHLRFIDNALVLPGIGDLPYRIGIPKILQRSGNLGLAPWTWELLPGRDLVDQGFHENEGTWIIVPLKDDHGFLVMRWGLLNTKVDGDKQTAEVAFAEVPVFVSNMYWAAKGEKGENIFTYGEHFVTK